jgi:hypothetical protein
MNGHLRTLVRVAMIDQAIGGYFQYPITAASMPLRVK